MTEDELEYVGFWPRFGAFIIDSMIVSVIIVPVLVYIYGWPSLFSNEFVRGPADFLLSYIFPAIAIVWLWIKRQSTPGKDVISAKIVDATTGAAPTTRQFIIRYLGYYVSIFPLLLGLIWVAFDPRKQGWHDKLARTVVVRPKKRVKEVTFDRVKSS